VRGPVSPHPALSGSAARLRHPISIVTKSSLILRDLDLLTDLATLPGTRVNFTITTLDPVLSRLVEPGTPPPTQ
jgi:DNA repair photolyase